jgi:hypothetical protein
LAERLCLHDIDDTVAFCGAIVGRSGIELSHYEREDLVAHLVGEAWIISTKYDESVGVAFSAWATLTLSGAWSTGNGSGSAAPPGSSRTASTNGRGPSSSVSITNEISWTNLSDRGLAILRTVATSASQGYSPREIGHGLGISGPSALRLLDELREELENQRP